MRYAIILSGMVLLFVSDAVSTTYTINPEGTGDYPTIQAAINVCSGGEIIELTDGTFAGDGNRDVDYLGKAITVRSQTGIADACIIDCEGSLADVHRGFIFQSGESESSVLENIKIVNGYAVGMSPIGCGGAVHCLDSSSPAITGCIFSGNAAILNGGAIFCIGGSSPALSGCTFTGNTAGLGGGGIACEVDASPTLNDCTFSENAANGGNYGGGGMQCDIGGCSPTLIECSFHANSGPWGGALAVYNGCSATLENCVFSENAAGVGGGICAALGPGIAITNCAFLNNTADPGSWGGGVCLYRNAGADISGCTFGGNTAGAGGGLMAFDQASCEVFVTGCTFYDNEGIVDGGAVDCSYEAVVATFTDCTLYNNSSPLGSGFMFDVGASGTIDNTIIACGIGGSGAFAGNPPTITCCDVYGNEGGPGTVAGQIGVNGNIAEDPLFCNPEFLHDFHLQAGSPCAEENNPECGQIGCWPIGCPYSDVTEERAKRPAGAQLQLSAAPNPSSGGTEVKFSIPGGDDCAPVVLNLHDTSGRLVRTLVRGAQKPGLQSVFWNGEDDAGRPVPAGVYLFQLRVGDKTLNRQLLLTR